MPTFRRKAYNMLFGCVLMSLASGRAAAQAEFLLWPSGAPGAKDTTSASKPSLAYFAPAKANGAAVIICPGGGYDHLAIDKEGYQVAKWINTLGVSAFVLKSRVAPYRHPIEMNDAQRAMRWVRANAKRYKIDPARIGILGFSAGGHLASTVATHYDNGNPSAPDTVDRQPCKPAFQILGYPVITMEGPFANGGSRINLLGENPPAATTRLLSNEKQIDVKTPAAFLFHTRDDEGVYVDNSIMYYDSLLKAGVPAQMKLYDHGPHGFGLANGVAGAPNIPEIAGWTGLCANWLRDRGFLTPTTGVREAAEGRARIKEGAVGRGLEAFRAGLLSLLGRWRAGSPPR